MTKCIMCENADAAKKFTWVNSGDEGVGGGMQGGDMCEPCMSLMWDALFPLARETVTIWPIAKTPQRSADPTP